MISQFVGECHRMRIAVNYNLLALCVQEAASVPLDSTGRVLTSVPALIPTTHLSLSDSQV